jgi:penicillin amidase
MELRVVRTRNGPLVDALLPAPARDTGPVSMRWLGTEVCDWTSALLRLNLATTVGGAMDACEGWLVPTFSLVLGDTAGDIGYLATGRIPIRRIPERGYRPGWDPAHAWDGLIPAAAMPRAISPAQGYLSSANNRPAPESFPYPLSGTWDEGYRQRHIGRVIEAGASDGAGLTISDMSRMHGDVRSLRAEERLGDLVRLVEGVADDADGHALALLRGWDLESTVDSAGAAIHHVLFARWAQAVVHERVADRDLADYLANWALGLASDLLVTDGPGWFGPGRRAAAARVAWRETLAELTAAMGPDPAAWSWGGIHQLELPHPLSGGTGLGPLLDKPPTPVPGDLVTLDNSGFDASRDGRGWVATSGAGYRLEVDLGAKPDAAWTITAESQSAMLGSRHFDDQRQDFVQGRVRCVPLDPTEVERMAVHVTRIVPNGDDA